MRFSMLQAVRIIAWFLAVIITVLSLVPPQLRPETGAPHDIEHFAIFFATGVAFGFGYYRRSFVIAIGLVIFAGTIEIAQIFVPGRHATFSDFIVDALSLTAGVVVASLLACRVLGRNA
jgi:VanZ family protein